MLDGLRPLGPQELAGATRVKLADPRGHASARSARPEAGGGGLRGGVHAPATGGPAVSGKPTLGLNCRGGDVPHH
eukprot:9984133-Alexandrium_andersonii.AAC.1